MPQGNPAIKLAITVDSEVHAEILNAAEAEGMSVSAWLAAERQVWADHRAPLGREPRTCSTPP